MTNRCFSEESECVCVCVSLLLHKEVLRELATTRQGSDSHKSSDKKKQRSQIIIIIIIILQVAPWAEPARQVEPGEAGEPGTF